MVAPVPGIVIVPKTISGETRSGAGEPSVSNPLLISNGAGICRKIRGYNESPQFRPRSTQPGKTMRINKVGEQE
jgi:hypothetical protein